MTPPSPNTDSVILVNNNDQPIGTMDKMQAHILGVLHRAFSVFIFDTLCAPSRLLLQNVLRPSIIVLDCGPTHAVLIHECMKLF